MIDIRQTVAEIVKAKDASDKAAFSVLTHNLIRQYGQELLFNLAGAITAVSAEEVMLVGWLKGEINKIAQQIPEPTIKEPKV